jgi:hypothetical protein
VANLYKIFGVHPSKLKVVSGTAFVDVLPYLNGFSMDINEEELTFEYDGTSDVIALPSTLTGTITLGKLNTDLLTKAMGIAEVTTALPADYSKIWHPDLGTYPYVEGVIRARVQDDAAAGAEAEIAIIVWKMKLGNLAISDLGNLEANEQTLSWSSTATTLDLLGDDIPGVTAPDTVHWSLANVA